MHFIASGRFYVCLEAALGSERLIQSYRVVWGALNVEIVLLSLLEALLDVGSLLHSVDNVESDSVTGEIFSYLHQGSQTTSSKLLDCPKAPLWIQGWLSAVLTFLEGQHIVLMHIILTVSSIQALHCATFIGSHSAFDSYFIVLICVLFLKYFYEDSEADFCARETEPKRFPLSSFSETESHTSSSSLKKKNQPITSQTVSWQTSQLVHSPSSTHFRRAAAALRPGEPLSSLCCNLFYGTLQQLMVFKVLLKSRDCPRTQAQVISVQSFA